MVVSLEPIRELRAKPAPVFSLEDFLKAPHENMEWVDGELIEKNQMTLRHSQIQLRLGSYWRSYAIANVRGGEVYTEVPVEPISKAAVPMSPI